MGQSTSQKLSENTGETLKKHPASALTHYLEVLFIIVVTADNYLNVIKTLTRKRFMRVTLESWIVVVNVIISGNFKQIENK